MPTNPEPVETRFWKHVERRGPDECWEWTAFLSPNGYGKFAKSKGHMVLAHRFSFEMTHGPLGKDCSLHACDNRKCVNPKHLFRGTQAINSKDMVNKGRQSRKLSDGQVRLIRLYGLNKWSHRKIADHFLVSRMTISKIIDGTRQSSVR
jgi:hypothetical protein